MHTYSRSWCGTRYCSHVGNQECRSSGDAWLEERRRRAPISVIMSSRAVMACGCLLRSRSMISLPASNATTSGGFSKVLGAGGGGARARLGPAGRLARPCRHPHSRHQPMTRLRSSLHQMSHHAFSVVLHLDSEHGR